MVPETPPRGTDNVLNDLGFPDADELAAKAILAKKINEILEKRGLSNDEAAELLGMPEGRILAIRNYKLRRISLQRLMTSLTTLGQHIEIVVSPSDKASTARIDV